MEPKLALAYSSRGGASAYGFGWSLSGLSQIQRGPRNLSDDGTVTGVQLRPDDAFHLDGEKLIEVPSDQIGVREFRTRIDTFVRVRAYSSNSSGPGYFVVETRAGLKMTYGQAPEARVALADGRAVSWLAQRIDDRSGNYMTFSYEFDDAGGVRGLDYVLKRVDYTGNDGQRLTPYASLVFDYERLPAAQHYAARYVLGQKTGLGWRLKSIVSSYGPRVLRRYVPSWRPTDESDRFTTLAEFTEAGPDGLQYRPLRFEYPKSRPGWQPSDLLGSIRDLPGIGDVVANVPKSYRFARLPKSGTLVPAVLISAAAGGKSVSETYLHDGATGQWRPDKNFRSPVLFAAAFGEADDVVLVDIDGDGDDDILSGNGLEGNEAATWVATTNGWEKRNALPIKIRGGTLSDSGVIEVDTLDLAGQRKVALAWHHTDPTTGRRLRDVRRWDGNAWASVPRYDEPPLPFSASAGAGVAGARAIDVNTDGTRELVYYRVTGGTGQRAVYSPTPNGWRAIPNPATYLLPLPDLPAESALKTADLDQDGFADLFWAFGSGPNREAGIRLASGSGWIADNRPIPEVSFWRSAGPAGEVVDLNGDGALDLVDGSLGSYTAWRADGAGWDRDDRLAPPSSIGSTGAERTVAFKLLRLQGSGTWTWLGLRPQGGLAPQSYRFDAATGWRPDITLKVPIDLAQFDKVDLGIRFLDLNNDGHPDLVWSRRRNDGSFERKVYLFDPKSTTPWREDQRFILPVALVREDYLATGTFVADINGDGRADLIEGRRAKEQGQTSDRREAWINCSALSTCANVPVDKVSGYWLPASASQEYQGLVPPTVFAADGVGPLGAQVLDVNGDGLSDIVTGREVEAWVNKNGKDVPPTSKDARPVYRLEARTWINNDGQSWVEKSEFRLPVPLVRPLIKAIFRRGLGDEAAFPGIAVVDAQVQLMDLNGDRLPELSYNYEALQKSKNQSDPLTVIRVPRKGARFGSGAGWVVDAPAYTPPVRLDDDPGAPSRQLQMEDVNNDGGIDLVFSDGANSATYLNTGIGWSSADAAFKLPAKVIRAGRGDQGFRIFDLNGDNLPDIAYHWTTEGGRERGAFMNTGNGWAEAPGDYAPGIAFAEHNRGDIGVRPLDVNGDGLLDLVQSYKRSESENSNQVQINGSSRPYLLTRAVNGIGGSTNVNYASFLDVPRFRKAGEAAEPEVRLKPGTGRPSVYPVIHAPLPGYLVGEILEQGKGVPARRLRYAYGGNRVDTRSGRSLGFETTYVHDVERRRTTVTQISQDDALLGSPLSSEVRQDGRIISRTESSWRVDRRPGLAGSTGAAGFIPEVVRRNLASSKTQSWDLDGVLLSSEDTSLTYDANGNAESVLVTFADGATSLTENRYDDYPTIWALSRVTQATVTLSEPKTPNRSPNQVRVARFGYDNSTGLLAWESTLVGTPYETVTRYVRDRFGNKTSSTTSAPDGAMARTESLVFDGEGRFAESAKNALGHRSTTTFDPVSGVALTRTDPNGLTTSAFYDGLQRLTAEVSSNGVRTTITNEFASIASAAIVTTRRTPGLPTTRSWTDASGRAVRTEQTGWKGRKIVSEMRYDVLGRSTETVLPHFDGTRTYVARREFDALDRVVSEVRPDGKEARVIYRGLEQISIDAAGVESTKRLDQRGRVFETVDALGGTTRFRFDAGGRVIETATVAGHKIIQAYNEAGHRTVLDDPSSGRWSYSYDLYGSVVSQTDARGETTTLTYDLLGRLVAKRTRDNHATWTYDAGDHAIGRLVASTSNDSHRRAIRYDRLGRPETTETTIGRDTLITKDRFDVHGRLVARQFGTGVTLRHRYDEQGQLVGMALNDGSVQRDIYEALEIDAAGRTRRQRVGNGIITSNDYDEVTGLLKGSITKAGAKDVQALTLGYDVVGNLTSMADATTGETGSFGYDKLRRLIHVEQSGRSDINVTYDGIGNITSKTNAGVYSYCDRGALKGLLCSVSGPGGALNLDYDAAGNVIRSGTRTINFGTDGKVAEIRGAAGTRSHFTYSGDGSLVTQDSLYAPKQHRYTTSYFDAVQLIRENYAPPGLPTPERTVVRHVLASADGIFGYYDKVYRHFPYRFASPVYGLTMTQKPERVTDLRYGFTYFVKDHLGSIRAAVGEDGKVVDRYRYDPWGLRIDADEYRYRHVKQGFTGHEMLDNLGLVHMGGRVYDPLLGRFLSPDPFIQAPYFSQSYNRYSYVMNNPLILVDPSGYWSLGRAVGSFFRSAGNAFRSVVDAVVGKPLAWVGEQLAKGGRWLEQNWQTVAIIALAVVIGPAATWYFAVLQGAALGGLSAALYGGGPDEILRGALIGGATAGAFHGVGTAGLENQAIAAGAHGTVGGLSSVAQGGTFESGFMSAAATKLSGAYVPESSSLALNVASAAVVGGVVAEIGGGSFENGAITGSFSRLFNDCSHGDLCRSNQGATLSERVDDWLTSLSEIPSDVANAFSSTYNYLSDAVGATGDFGEAYLDMRSATAMGGGWKEQDKYFHCRANCEASMRGDAGRATAQRISNMRESFDMHVKRNSLADSLRDQRYNRYGRDAATQNPGMSCRDLCAPTRPRGLPPQF